MESSKKSLFILLLLLSVNTTINAAICTALASGNWSNPANWSCGSVPSCGDFIDIPAGITIMVDIQVDLDENSSPACSTSTYIQVSGVLKFITGNKISLACGSGVEVMPSGAMLPGGGGGSSNWLKICDVTEWQTSDGPVIGYKLFGNPFPLPVEFIAFQVEKNAGMYVFNWSVASERDNDFFTIDYSSDGYDWTEMTKVISVGDHNDGENYTFSSDLDFSKNLNTYFRLTQTDMNGEFEILDVKALKNETQDVSIFPNPAKLGEDFIVALNSTTQQTTDVILFNAQGQIIHNQSTDLTIGVNHVTITPLNVNRGIYFVKIPSISSVEVYRLIIE